MSQFIFKPNTENLKNALAAVVERAISSIKRFATALHNKCNLVVYTDGFGRTCCQFIKKDAFSGYHFDFSGSNCVITNKETGEVYKAVYSPDFKFCSCPAFKFSPLPKQPCKHLKMIVAASFEVTREFALASNPGWNIPVAMLRAELFPRKSLISNEHCSDFAEFKGDLEQVIENMEPEQHVESFAQAEIDPKDIPTGCRLERSDDWISLEYYVHVWGHENQRGIPTLIQKNIGRLVQHPDGIYAYRVRSGIGRTFGNAHDALAYLVRLIGTSFEEIAQAYGLHENLVTKRISKL